MGAGDLDRRRSARRSGCSATAKRSLHLLQTVATAILSVLAPILALGLVLFVVALPFTGMGPLWSQTKATTPILLVCVLGAVVLINAVVGNGAEEEATSPLLRVGRRWRSRRSFCRSR